MNFIIACIIAYLGISIVVIVESWCFIPKWLSQMIDSIQENVCISQEFYLSVGNFTRKKVMKQISQEIRKL